MQLAGMEFVQNWSSLCYHFSGRGSRRKDIPTKDSEEWQKSNQKNERNFVRKWGTSVRHDQLLRPIARRRRPVSLVGLLGNERNNIEQWLTLLEPYFEEVLLVDDSSDGSASIALEYNRRESQASSIVANDKIRLISHALRGDYSAARNRAQSLIAFDWALHVDLDERIEPPALEQLQDLIDDLESRNIEVCGLPRLNTLNDVVVNDIPRVNWTVDQLSKLRVENDETRAIVNPDIQYRLVRSHIRWIFPVHEVPEIVHSGSIQGQDQKIATCSSFWITHAKSLRRQAEQDSKYRELVGNKGPHGLWDSRKVLADMGEKEIE